MPPKSRERLCMEDVQGGTQCRVCCRDALVAAQKRPRESDEEVSLSSLAIRNGRFNGEYNNSTVKRHLKEQHDITVDSFGNWNDKGKEFFNNCQDFQGSHGWGNFGCVVPDDSSVISVLKKSARKASRPPLLDRVAIFFASSYTPFKQVENTAFRNLLDEPESVPNRTTLRNHAINMADNLTSAFLKKHKGKIGKLTVDVGTVWNRYVGVCLHIPGTLPIVYRLVDDYTVANVIQSDDDGDEVENDNDAAPVLSGDVCAEMISNIAGELHNAGIVVGSITTDNGSNMVSMSASANGPYGNIFQIRCACHCLQLMVNSCLDEAGSLREAWLAVVAFVDKCHASENYHVKNLKFPKLQETRWDSKFKLCEAVYNLVTNEVAYGRVAQDVTMVRTDIRKAKLLLDFLKQFNIATRMCEANDATLTTVLAALSVIQWNTLYATAAPQSRLKAQLDNHFTKFVSPALVIVAYFTPVYNMYNVDKDAQQLTLLQSCIGGWLKKGVVGQMALQVGANPSFIANEFEAYKSMDVPVHGNHNANTLNAWLKEVSSPSAKFETPVPHLAAVVRAINLFSPSEAEVERVFRRTKLTVPKHRINMKPQTVEAMVKLNVFNASTAAQQVTVHSDSDDEVEEAPPTVDPIVVIWVLQEALKKIRNRGVKYRSDKCAKCNREIASQSSECKLCHRRYHSNSCVNSVSATFTCAECQDRNDVPWW